MLLLCLLVWPVMPFVYHYFIIAKTLPFLIIFVHMATDITVFLAQTISNHTLLFTLKQNLKFKNGHSLLCFPLFSGVKINSLYIRSNAFIFCQLFHFNFKIE